MLVKRILTYTDGTYLSIEDTRGRWYVIDADSAAHLPAPHDDSSANPGLIDSQYAPPNDVTATGVLLMGAARRGTPPRYRLNSLDGREDLDVSPGEYATVRAAGRRALRVTVNRAETSVTVGDRAPASAAGPRTRGRWKESAL